MHVVHIRLITAIVLGASLIVAGFSATLADDSGTATLSIEQAHTLATPPGANVAAGYLTLSNNGATADRLVGGAAPFADVVEIHVTRVENDVATMRELDEGLVLPPGETVTLASGGLHLMFIGLEAPLSEGDSHTVTLNFEQAGEMDIAFEVRGIGAQGVNHGMKHDMKHDMNPDSDADKQMDGHMNMKHDSDPGSMSHEGMEESTEMKTAE